jgi:hypothetical protein
MADESRTYRDASRDNWVPGIGQQLGTVEQINCGSMQRIADAVELVAKGYGTLEREREYYKREHDRMCHRNAALEKSNAALRGVITRMKRATG